MKEPSEKKGPKIDWDLPIVSLSGVKHKLIRNVGGPYPYAIVTESENSPKLVDEYGYDCVEKRVIKNEGVSLRTKKETYTNEELVKLVKSNEKKIRSLSAELEKIVELNSLKLIEDQDENRFWSGKSLDQNQHQEGV